MQDIRPVTRQFSKASGSYERTAVQGDNTATPFFDKEIFDDVEEAKGASLYLRKVTLIRTEALATQNVHDSFAQLPPPGNPVWWLATDMEAMDDWRAVGRHDIVLDARQQPVRIDIDAALRSNEPGDKPLSRKNVISLQKALQMPIWCEIQLPGIDTLRRVLQTPIVYPPVPWNDIRRYVGQEQLDMFDEMIQITPDEFDEVKAVNIYTDGSYFGQYDHLAGWAFAAVADVGDPICLAIDFGIVSLEPLEKGWIGATRSDARAGEATALVRALEWALAHRQFQEVNFCFDAQSVGFGADGIYGFSLQELPLRIARALTLALRQQEGVEVTMNYVKAHSGIFYNELVDAMAKLAAKEQRNFIDEDRPDYCATATGPRSILDSLWLYMGNQSEAYPSISNGKLVLPEYGQDSGLEGRLPPAVLPDPTPHTTDIKTVKLSAITYNVQSLGARAGPGQTQYIREQLAHGGYEIAFLQETRTKHSNMVVSDSHIRLCSEARNGKGGTEIWLLRHHGASTKELFPKQSIQVLYSDSEIIIAQVIYMSMACLLCSAHAPHSGHSAKVIEDFWDKLTVELLPLSKRHANVLIGIDANAHFASGNGQAVGDHGLEEQENLSGRCFKDFLHKIDGFLPSTYAWIHEGETTTWVSNVNGHRARCDYSVCPADWTKQQIKTYPVYWLDEGNSGTDHAPLALDCCLQQRVRGRPGVRQQFDRRALQQADSRWLAQQFADFQSPAWHVSVDRHATTVTRWIEEKLTTIFPVVKTRPRKSYISQKTWKMRGERIRLKKSILFAQSEAGNCTLQHVFDALKQLHPFSHRQAFFELVGWLRLLIVRKRALAGHTKLLTRSLKTDRTMMLEEIASQSRTMNAAEMAAALRSIGIRSRKKPSCIMPLPMVQNAAGTIISTLEELAETWRQHFARQEDGSCVEPTEQLNEVSRAIEHKIKPNIDDLPTWLEIEAAFRRTSKKKAFFDDGISGDLLAAIPACMTKIFMPLFMKKVLYQREALIYKGGRLIPAFKKGSPLRCENYRSLFVSSPVGKALHSLYRGQLGKQFEQSRCSMQLGGLKGHGITHVSHSIHLCHSWAIANHCSFAVLFVDIQNAFYRLLREHIVSGSNDERTAQAIFDSLALPQETFDEFCEFYDQGPALDNSGTSPFMRSLFREFYSRTWFTVPGSEQWTQTKRGSRPGDSFADICFGFALSKLLHRLEDTLVCRFPFLQLGWNGNHDPFWPEANQILGPLIPVWADDLALVIFHDSPIDLLRLLPEVTTEVLHQLAVIGLQPNMKAGKTELLLDLRGKGSLRARQELAHQNYQFPLAMSLITEALRVVGMYRHLGTIIQLGGRTQKILRSSLGRPMKLSQDTGHKFSRTGNCNSVTSSNCLTLW